MSATKIPIMAVETVESYRYKDRSIAEYRDGSLRLIACKISQAEEMALAYWLLQRNKIPMLTATFPELNAAKELAESLDNVEDVLTFLAGLPPQ